MNLLNLFLSRENSLHSLYYVVGRRKRKQKEISRQDRMKSGFFNVFVLHMYSFPYIKYGFLFVVG